MLVPRLRILDDNNLMLHQLPDKEVLYVNILRASPVDDGVLHHGIFILVIVKQVDYSLNTPSPEGRAESLGNMTYKERIISRAASGETQETQETKVLVDKPKYSSSTKHGGATPYVIV